MSLFETRTPEPIQRRSRIEIACDILQVISTGVKRPTPIMAKSNLPWSTLLTYLDALVRNNFIEVQFNGKFPTYHLAARGATALSHYEDLRDDMEALKLGSLSNRVTRAALKTGVAGSLGGSPKARLIEKLKRDRMRVIDSSIVGKTGVRHEYDVVAKSENGLLHVYSVVQDVTENHMLSMHAKQLDTDALSHVMYSGEVNQGALRLAKSYHIELTSW